MSTFTVDIFTEKQLDWTITERLRRAVVAAGYLPDITTFNEVSDYEEAKETLRTSKKLIDVKGTGSPQGRDAKTENTITVKRAWGVLSGIRGGTPYYVPVDGGFVKRLLPARQHTVGYTVRVVTNTAEYDRICSSLVRQALGIFDFVDIIDESTKLFTGGKALLEYMRNTEVFVLQSKDRVFSYQFTDVWLDDIPVAEEEVVIPPLVQITARVAPKAVLKPMQFEPGQFIVEHVFTPPPEED